MTCFQHSFNLRCFVTFLNIIFIFLMQIILIHDPIIKYNLNNIKSPDPQMSVLMFHFCYTKTSAEKKSRDTRKEELIVSINEEQIISEPSKTS